MHYCSMSRRLLFRGLPATPPDDMQAVVAGRAEWEELALRIADALGLGISYISRSSATPTERIYMWGENCQYDFLITLQIPFK